MCNFFFSVSTSRYFYTLLKNILKFISTAQKKPCVIHMQARHVRLTSIKSFVIHNRS